jgi:hypothetical protein
MEMVAGFLLSLSWGVVMGGRVRGRLTLQLLFHTRGEFVSIGILI